MSSKADPKTIFYKYFPNEAVEYCFSLWKNYNFKFKITTSRKSKFGDYKYVFATQSHTITVNADLNPFSFLVTYLHEVAHLTTQLKYGNKPEPHGIEWKNEFKNLAKPMLNTQIFPPNILAVFSNYLINPKASSCSDHDLLEALRTFDEPDDKITLLTLKIGEVFDLQDKKFVKDKINRTRSLCTEIESGKKYLISNAARVLKIA